MDYLLRVAELLAGIAVSAGLYAWYQVTFVMAG